MGPLMDHDGAWDVDVNMIITIYDVFRISKTRTREVSEKIIWQHDGQTSIRSLELPNY
jgi:hypothetical protein